MKHKKNIFLLLVFSFGFSGIGFIADLHERVPDVWVNIAEILMMTILIFVVFMACYFLFVLLRLFFSTTS